VGCEHRIRVGRRGAQPVVAVRTRADVDETRAVGGVGRRTTVTRRYLSEYDVAEVHACVVNGDEKRTWEEIRNADLSCIPVVHLLLVLRSLPGRLKAINSGQAAPAPPPFSLGDMPRVGFQLLGERPAEIALGFVGKPWKVGAKQPLAIGHDDFAAFNIPVTPRSPSASGPSHTGPTER
jgi:hypothetical protein